MGVSHTRVRAALRERLRGQGATGRQIAEALMAEFKVTVTRNVSVVQ